MFEDDGEVKKLYEALCLFKELQTSKLKIKLMRIFQIADDDDDELNTLAYDESSLKLFLCSCILKLGAFEEHY